MPPQREGHFYGLVLVRGLDNGLIERNINQKPSLAFELDRLIFGLIAGDFYSHTVFNSFAFDRGGIVADNSLLKFGKDRLAYFKFVVLKHTLAAHFFFHINNNWRFHVGSHLSRVFGNCNNAKGTKGLIRRLYIQTLKIAFG